MKYNIKMEYLVEADDKPQAFDRLVKYETDVVYNTRQKWAKEFRDAGKPHDPVEVELIDVEVVEVKGVVEVKEVEEVDDVVSL